MCAIFRLPVDKCTFQSISHALWQTDLHSYCNKKFTLIEKLKMADQLATFLWFIGTRSFPLIHTQFSTAAPTLPDVVVNICRFGHIPSGSTSTE